MWYGSCRFHVVMVAWGLRIRVLPAGREGVLRLLRGLLEPARVRSGCLACHAYQDVEDPDAMSLVQEWADAADLERYLRSEDRRTLVAVLELAAERPQVWLDTIATREGLDRLAALMGSTVEPP